MKNDSKNTIWFRRYLTFMEELKVVSFTPAAIRSRTLLCRLILVLNLMTVVLANAEITEHAMEFTISFTPPSLDLVEFFLNSKVTLQ